MRSDFDSEGTRSATAHCPFGETVRFEELGHVELLFRPEVFAVVLAAIRA